LKLNVLRPVLLTVCVGMTASVLALAQAPPPVIKIIREEVRVGHDASHAINEAAYVKALSKAGYVNYLGMTAVSGPREAWFLEYYPSYAGVEAARALGDKEPVKSELDQLDVKDADSVSASRTLLAVFEKDLSFMPDRPRGKLHFVSVLMVRVRMGHIADFAKLRAMANDGWSSGGVAGRMLVYRVTSGAPYGTYIVLRAMESLKDLDPDPSVRSLSQAMGADKYAEFLKLMGETELSLETWIFAVSPGMSYPPKEMSGADPSFWTVPTSQMAKGTKKKK
jgi:hypothetical protein